MHAISISSAPSPSWWRGFGGLAEPLLRMWRLVVGTMLAAPVVIAAEILFASDFASTDVPHRATRFVLANLCLLLLIAFGLILSNPRLISASWRVVVATVLVSPWAALSAMLFSSLSRSHSVEVFLLVLFVALGCGMVVVCGFRMMIWPPPPEPPRWWSFPPSPPDPPPGGAKVPAPLKPPPPVLIASAAKALPRELDDGEDSQL